MPDTTRLTLPQSQWTMVVAGPLTDCLVTISRPVFYVYAASLPTWEAGHSLDAFENMNAAPADGQNYYVLSPHGDAIAWVTVG